MRYLVYVSGFSDLGVKSPKLTSQISTPGRPLGRCRHCRKMPAAAVTPLTDDEVKAKEPYLIIYNQFQTPKGIEVEVGKEYWPNLPNLPDTIKGVMDSHVNKA